MSEYEVELFRMGKFQRRKCPKCGRFFWTGGEQIACGEPPCEEYSFIGNSPVRKKFNLHEMRELYLKFFEKNGHKRISRYPIVARWRDDVFFTQASIYCFQPWVLLGVVKPPANPLTISQTCVRFNDIDNVGKTGRHFTMFEMMAHHAFNTKGNFIYFKDGTVELCHNLLTKELGINPEKISYIEAQWAGGGNSGPCFEVIVNGIELATLVFMMYEEKNGTKKEMEMQVVDTGYGLERFTWLSQGTSSAYEAVFGTVLEKLKRELGLESNSRVLSEYSRVAGLMKVESANDHERIKRETARKLSISVEELQKIITPIENLYAVCDHTRALMFMLNDGVMPSNVKEGYFARLLVRRALRSMEYLGLNMPISDIVKLQINYFRDDFPEINENKDEILKLADIEEDKFRKTAERGKGVIKKLEEKISADRGDRIEVDNLLELYDSNGLTPDFVKEFSSLKVEIPSDFYMRVVQRHEKYKVERRIIENSLIPEGKVKPTILGFYEDPNVLKFRAKRVLDMINWKGGNFLILDKTYFYAEGGGQESDRGKINGVSVVDVQKIGNVIIHKVEGDISKIPDEVHCEIDLERRMQLMQHHTATHIINGAARSVLGSHVWQTGAHKGVDSARLDITHYAGLEDKEIEEIENLANKAVKENRNIEISSMERNDAEKRYGFRLYQGGAVPGGEIRVVNIKDWDVEACGGMHLSNTTEVGLIKITGSKRIQDGVVRLEFVAGKATERYEKKIIENLVDYVCKFTIKLKLNEDTKNKAIEILKEAQKKGILHRRSSPSLAAAAIYLAGKITKDRELIVEKKHEEVSEEIIRKRYEELAKSLNYRDTLEGIASVFSVSVEQLPKTIERFQREWNLQFEELKKLEEGAEQKFSMKYGEFPDANTYESAKQLFEEWKSQRKEIQVLREGAGKKLREKLKERFKSGFEEKNGVKIVKEIVYNFDIKTMTEISREIIEPKSILILLNISGESCNFVVSSNSNLNADEIAKNLSKLLGGGSHGDKNFAVGGGKSKDAERILKEFRI